MSSHPTKVTLMNPHHRSRPALTAAPAVAQALRSEVEKAGLSQSTLGRRMMEITGEPWPQSRVWKLLHNRTGIKLTDVEALCIALGIKLSELIARALSAAERPGRLTADEEDILTIYRRNTPLYRSFLHTLLESAKKRHWPELTLDGEMPKGAKRRGTAHRRADRHVG
jgi:transcriptional regulator with XRE-family HTH domain